MLHFQTIKVSHDEDREHKNDGEFVSTHFDNELESCLVSLTEAGYIIGNVIVNPTNTMMIGVIIYHDAEDVQKAIMAKKQMEGLIIPPIPR